MRVHRIGEFFYADGVRYRCMRQLPCLDRCLGCCFRDGDRACYPPGLYYLCIGRDDGEYVYYKLAKTLHLVVTYEWFDMINSGEKKHEYRVFKPHWAKVFEYWKQYDTVTFHRGYTRTTCEFVLENVYPPTLSQYMAKEALGADLSKNLYTLVLGDRVERGGDV